MSNQTPDQTYMFGSLKRCNQRFNKIHTTNYEQTCETH